MIDGYKLDEFQMNAVMSNHDATVVVAGAGSGKTFTIIGKIKYLIEKCNINEKEILCISFTKACVNNLIDKLDSYNIKCDVKTFHKLGLDILESNYSIIPNNYLDYIIDEYFKSYIKYNNKKFKLLKNIYYTDSNSFFRSKDYEELKYNIKYFIDLAKSNAITINELFKYYKKMVFSNKKIIKYIMDIYLIYERELNSSNLIDFNDMLIKATNSKNINKLHYKYIIIDEFQDTSIIRFNLILNIIKYTKAKLMVVGDDYQSIYKFNGCNVDIFLNIKKYIKDTEYFYLKYTYRNSNELIHVSTCFIMKNKNQLKKSIISNKSIKKPIIIVFNHNYKDYITDDTLIIGRNNKDIINIEYNNKLTIHKSKGLEARNVILVNSDNIPNKIKENSIISLLIKKDKYILYEEERRLFYVALTRCKDTIYIIVNKKISPFVKELIHDYKDYISIIK